MSQIESTHKPRDVEEVIDIYFYRPIGYMIARVSKSLAITPNAVTVISIIIGMIAGHLFYYHDLWTNVIGMLLLILSEAMDSADGQLARMTNRHSRLGRILDGFAGNLIFISIYVHLCLRLMTEGSSAWIFAVAVLSALSHSFQCAMADYYRNAYLYFVYGEQKSELDKSASIAGTFQRITWTGSPVKKFLVRIYLNYTYQQELLARNFQRLYATTRERYGVTVPDWLSERYMEGNRPLLKYYNFITTNTRIIALFIALFINRVFLYFAFELIVLNAVLFILTLYQEKLNARLLRMIEIPEGVH